MPITEHGPIELRPGKWTTLETFYGWVGSTIFIFQQPAHIKLKVRYGVGWAGNDRQEKETDGQSVKKLYVSGFVGRARVQARASKTTYVAWDRITEGP